MHDAHRGRAPGAGSQVRSGAPSTSSSRSAPSTTTQRAAWAGRRRARCAPNSAARRPAASSGSDAASTAGVERTDDPGGQPLPVGRLGGGADVVHDEHGSSGWAAGAGLGPGGDERREVGAGLAGEDQRGTVAVDVGVEPRRPRPAARPGPARRAAPNARWAAASRASGSGSSSAGNSSSTIAVSSASTCWPSVLRRRRSRWHGWPEPRTRSFSCSSLATFSGTASPSTSCSSGERDAIHGRIAEVEERVPGGVGVVEDAVQDLHLGDRRARQRAEPRQLLDQVPGELLGHPAVALAEQAEEERPAAVDLGQADRAAPRPRPSARR